MDVVLGRGQPRVTLLRWRFTALLVVAFAAVGSAVSLPGRAHAMPLPPPSYENTLHAALYARDFLDPRAADEIADLFAHHGIQGGPWARVGVAGYFAVDVPWSTPASGLADPALTVTTPSRTAMRALLDRLRARGLTLHVSLMGAMSRAVYYTREARLADRRNAQWFADGEIGAPRAAGTGDTEARVSSAWGTPSRYARRLRRHAEAKIRAMGRELTLLRREYPDVLVTASGDAEAELNSDRVDESKPLAQQVLADYSPFAVLEFRDWLLHSGLYAAGGPYAGQGYVRDPTDAFVQGGAAALTAENLAAFNASFGTEFTSWELRYFRWSLADSVDDDPRAIPFSRFSNGGFRPLPGARRDFLAGGFDAPRAWVAAPDPGARFWGVWLRFREAMLHAYVADFASWVTTAQDDQGESWPADRFFSHQIPGEYLGGRRPGVGELVPRALTSASATSTALVPGDVGTPGWTILDVLVPCENGPGSCTVRTSEHLFDSPGETGDLTALGLTRFGVPEYAPSWWVSDVERDVDAIVGQYRRAQASGAHLLGLTPFGHFERVDFPQNAQALARFLAEAGRAPREARRIAYTPPAVRDLTGTVAGAGQAARASVGWASTLFSSRADLAWPAWSGFARFEVWRGSRAGFDRGTGQRVTTTLATTSSGLVLDDERPWYRVAAVATDGQIGPFSNAVRLDRPGGGGTTRPRLIRTRACRLLDTRGTAGGGPLQPGAPRTVAVVGRCGIPTDAAAVSLVARFSNATAAGAAAVQPGSWPAILPVRWAWSRSRPATRSSLVAVGSNGTVTLSSEPSSGRVTVALDVVGWLRE